MKSILLSMFSRILLFVIILSSVQFQNYFEKNDYSLSSTKTMTNVEMGKTFGGDAPSIMISGNGDTFYWMLGGAALGFIVAGSAGILPGALIGGLLWFFLG